MIISYWNVNNSFMQNAKANLMASVIGSGNAYGQINRIVDKFGVDGDFIGEVEMLPYIRNTYGAEKPVCVGDKIIRELHRILLQIRDEADRFINNIDDFLDNTIPGWSDAGQVWSVFQDEVLTTFEDEVLKPLEQGLKDAWNDFTDWVKDPC